MAISGSISQNLQPFIGNRDVSIWILELADKRQTNKPNNLQMNILIIKVFRSNGNICYMTYRYSVLYFLNLFMKHFYPTENGNFCENIQIRRPFSFRVLTCRACPIDVLEDKCISLLN